MNSEITQEVSRASLQIRFDGPALAEHAMDVTLLGPSLTGLGELLKDANRILNGNDAKVRVSMNADVQANCVTLDFTVVQGFYESLKQLISTDSFRSAKEILEWIGIIGGSITGSWTVFKVFAWIGSKRKKKEKIIVKEAGNVVIINIEGSDNKITIPKEVFQLASDHSIESDVKHLLSPMEADGVDKATFIHKHKEVVVPKDEAKQIIESSAADLDQTAEQQYVVGHIVIHSPVFDEHSKIWKFKWNDRVEAIDVSHTTIPHDVMTRGKVVYGDSYRVRMKVTERRVKKGYRYDFEIAEVLGFVPSPNEQGELIWERQSDESQTSTGEEEAGAVHA